jgi:formiminotetrahydrofolate cyclodeaminase
MLNDYMTALKMPKIQMKKKIGMKKMQEGLKKAINVT